MKVADIQVANSRTVFKTILGSCVAVCLWDRVSGLGGMNHFLLPQTFGDTELQKFGDYSTANLISQMYSMGSNSSSIQAKIFGGANIVSVISSPIGENNVSAAKRILKEHNIQIAAEDTGGTRSRFLHFDTLDGKVTVRYK